MKAKLTIFANNNSGKTQTLKALIYLLAKSATQLSQPCVINTNYHPTFNMLSQIPFANEIRIAFMYPFSLNKSCCLSICTKGDNDIEVRKNWDFFLLRKEFGAPFNGNQDIELPMPNICVSPCHPSDNSREQEEYEEHSHKAENIILWQKMRDIDNSHNMVSNEEVKLYLSEMEQHQVFYTRGVPPTLEQKENSVRVAIILKRQIDDIINNQYFI